MSGRADYFYNNYPNEKKSSRYKRKQHYIHDKLVETYSITF